MAPVELTCRDFVDFLSDYLDGELAGEIREGFEAHLALCPDCVAYLATFRESVRLGRECASDEDRPPADAPLELVAAVLAARRRGQ
jgi:anti-sigma factor RsiW